MDVGLQGKLDPGAWARERDPNGRVADRRGARSGRKSELQWQVAKALYDAVQVYQMRGNPDEALRQGQPAIDYLEKCGG